MTTPSTAPAPGLPVLPSPEAVLERAAGENFPVAVLAPRRLRGHLRAIYGFARLADDLGDEAGGDRTAALDWLEAELDRIAAGREASHPLTRRLAATVAACDLPVAPLRSLVAANRRDQLVTHYETWGELRAYCELSANPVGHLVLHLFGVATPDRIARADAVCTGLQLVEHCQDVPEDARRGRIYLPAEDRRRYGCRAADLTDRRASPALRAVLAFELERASVLLADGVPLVASLPGRARLVVAGFVAGGRAAIAAVRAAGYDVGPGPPEPGRLAVAREILRVLGEARGWS